jgi:hypothetical protein
MSRLRQVTQTEQGALLRFLLVRDSEVSAGASVGLVLQAGEMTSGKSFETHYEMAEP